MSKKRLEKKLRREKEITRELGHRLLEAHEVNRDLETSLDEATGLLIEGWEMISDLMEKIS